MAGCAGMTTKIGNCEDRTRSGILPIKLTQYR